jgi:hypothetical protein
LAGWSIASFDRALARGTIVSNLGTLPFDAAIATVDDFTIGEEVEVALRPSPRSTAGYEVTRVAPVSFRAPFEAQTVAAIAAEIEGWVHHVRGRRVSIAGVEDGDVRLRVEDDTYQPERALLFSGVVMVQGPLEIDAIGAVRVYAIGDVAHVAPELVRYWPHIPERCVVFRVDPMGFEAPLYLAGEGVRLVVG